MVHTHFCEPHIHGFWIIPCLFIILMIFFAAPHFRRAFNGNGKGGTRLSRRWTTCCGSHRRSGMDWKNDTPNEILNRRYARGEITQEEYEQMKRDIEPDPISQESEDESR